MTAQLSLPVTIALVAGIAVALAFIGGLIFLALRGRTRPEGPPDIPPGMQPGPADDVLERRQLERIMGWAIIFVLIFAVNVALVWLQEPTQNVDDEIELVDRATERGARWFAVADEENPTGFGCARCHGEEAQGGSVPFTTDTGEFIPDYPVPPLNNVCGRLTIEGPGQIRETIQQGREGTPMPSWSVRYAGPMNDQQIQDLINFIVEINQENVPPEENLCLRPPTAAEGAEAGPTPGPSPTGDGGTPAGAGGSPTPEASPEEGQ